MTGRRVLLRVAVIITAALVQVCILNRIPLPGESPDLLLLCVVAFALVGGPQRGAVLGFFAGLTADLMPPADHTVGRLAFAYAIIGYLAGLLEEIEETSVVTTMLVVAGGSVALVLLYAGVGTLLGDPRITPVATFHSLLSTVVYDVVLAPFVVPLISGAARRLEFSGSR